MPTSTPPRLPPPQGVWNTQSSRCRMSRNGVSPPPCKPFPTLSAASSWPPRPAGPRRTRHSSASRANLAETMSNQLAFQMALIEALMAESPAAGPSSGGTGTEPMPPTYASEDVGSGPEEVPPTGGRGGRGRCSTATSAWSSPSARSRRCSAPSSPRSTPTRPGSGCPDEPLMLVDRILTIEGEPRSLTSGRVVTEHDVLPGAWYLDGGRIPTCIAVESGQADLFLSGYLGIDFVTQGLAVYRLLDAVGDLPPRPARARRGDPLRHPDRRTSSARGTRTCSGSSSRRRSTASRLMSMRDGCAGFFTAEELAAGKGIVHTALDLQPAARRPARRLGRPGADGRRVVRRRPGRGAPAGRPGRRVRAGVRGARPARPGPPAGRAG